MAFIQKCFCCSLPVACGFFATYLLIAYLIAFAFELSWIILESSTSLPAAAVLLAAGYFTLSLFAALLLHGIATRNTLCLVTWMFSITILAFPEAGLAIYMSIDYWGTGHLYGITELSCWLIRIIANVIEIILIQSLYTAWKDEELVDKRLNNLAVPVAGNNGQVVNPPFYQNNGYEQSINNFNELLARSGSVPQLWHYPYQNNLAQGLSPFGGYQFFSAQSEFNASIFMPPYGSNEMLDKKAHSLMDLRFIDQPASHLFNGAHSWKSLSDSGDNQEIIPNTKAMSEIGYPAYSKLTKCRSMDALNDFNKESRIIRNSAGFYAQPMPNCGVPIYYGPLDGPDFLIYKKQMDKLTSKNSLSNTSTEDVQKYRDVAL